MEQLSIFSLILIVLWFANVLLVPVLGLSSMWYSFVFRAEDPELGRKYQKLKWFRDESMCRDDTSMSWLLGDLCSIGFLTAVLVFLIEHTPPIVGLVVLCLIVSPFICRGIADISKTLRMNWKTGDSERLAALEAEIQRIKGGK